MVVGLLCFFLQCLVFFLMVFLMVFMVLVRCLYVFLMVVCLPPTLMDLHGPAAASAHGIWVSPSLVAVPPVQLQPGAAELFASTAGGILGCQRGTSSKVACSTRSMLKWKRPTLGA